MIGAIAAARRALPDPQGAPPLPWRLRALPVCGSTEWELEHWLGGASPACFAPGGERLVIPLAVLARRQRFGHGQHGRPWLAPPGGVWLSAALPWPEDPAAAASPALAVAVGLAQQLEALGLEVRIKWPNDLLLQGPDGTWRKLAGLLPGLRMRGGRIRWARVGVGLNGRNRVPAGATGLAAAAGTGRGEPRRLAARVLAALEWAVAWAGRPEGVRRRAERRLLLPANPIPADGELWRPVGLASDGALLLESRGRRRRLDRRRGEARLAGGIP
ncbi:MAG: biotin--[acetyl-CoA-carboxylase] ligase [Synechococcaceae cyanobacterium]|nr:biotin--[acetyl-CoA-carboxylase] ligase [Synechococcaceae cyanobacterium]